MNNEVDDTKPYPGRNGVGIAVPAVDEHTHVVKHVEEGEFLLPEDDKDGVDKFGKFGEREKEGPQSTALAPHIGPGVTECVAPSPEVDHLRCQHCSPHDAKDAEGPEERAPHAESCTEVKRFPVLHVALPPPDEEEVQGREVERPVPAGIHPGDGLLLIKPALHQVQELQRMIGIVE